MYNYHPPPPQPFERVELRARLKAQTEYEGFFGGDLLHLFLGPPITFVASSSLLGTDALCCLIHLFLGDGLRGL